MDEKILYHNIKRSYHTDFYRDTNNLNMVGTRGKDGYKFTIDTSSTKEEDYVVNFANKMTTVSSLIKSCKVVRNGDKLSIKLYSGHKKRSVGVHYFRHVKNIWYLTINLKSGDLYTGFLLNFQNKKKRQTKVRRNNFYSSELQQFLFNLKDFLNNIIVEKESRAEEIRHILNVFKTELLSEFPSQGFLPSSPFKLLYPFYLHKKGVKFPNNVNAFTDNEDDYGYLPTLKDFRKANMKYIDALMLKNGLVGDKLKKLLHKIQNYKMEHYRIAVGLFGIDWIHQDTELLEKLITNPPSHRYYANLGRNNDMFRFDVSIAEKKRAFNLFRRLVLDNFSLSTFLDHVRFLDDLKRFGENVRWESRTDEEFNREHMFFSDLKRSHTRGNYTRIYSDGFYNAFKQFEHDGLTYSPIVLKTTGEFNEESSYQSNCVRGYIDSANSFIVSLRKKDERATVEYKIFMSDKDKVTMERVQYLTKHNKSLDSSWDKPLKTLDEMVKHNLNNFVFNMELKWETKSTSKRFKLVKGQNNFVKFADEDGNSTIQFFSLNLF